jgi:hypothetical protein
MLSLQQNHDLGKGYFGSLTSLDAVFINLYTKYLLLIFCHLDKWNFGGVMEVKFRLKWIWIRIVDNFESFAVKSDKEVKCWIWWNGSQKKVQQVGETAAYLYADEMTQCRLKMRWWRPIAGLFFGSGKRKSNK